MYLLYGYKATSKTDRKKLERDTIRVLKINLIKRKTNDEVKWDRTLIGEGNIWKHKNDKSSDGTCTTKRRVTKNNYRWKIRRGGPSSKEDPFTVHKQNN